MNFMMPIMDEPRIKSIPWGLIEPHEKQAQRNHFQTLKRLAERGGLGVCEAVAILRDREWEKMDREDAYKQLAQMVILYVGAGAKPVTGDY